jgi:hypothetical protein
VSAVNLSFGSAAIALGMALAHSANALPAVGHVAGGPTLIELADARAYRHCHNLPSRTYCHKSARLPRNWPPNSETPARNRQLRRGSLSNCPSTAKK